MRANSASSDERRDASLRLRPCRRTRTNAPSATATSTIPIRLRPGPMTRPSASGIAIPVASAASRPICCGPCREARGSPSARRDTQAVSPAGRAAPRTAARCDRRCRRSRKNATTGQRARAEAEDRQRRQRTERQPAGPHEPVADAAERTAQRRAKTLDALRRLAVELRARERADGDRREIRMRVEVVTLPRQRGLERLAVHAARQQPQRRLDGEPDAVSEQSSRSSTRLGSRAGARRSRRACGMEARALALRRRSASLREEQKSPTARPPRKNHRAPVRGVKELPRGAAGDARRDADDEAPRHPRIRRPPRDAERRERREQRVGDRREQESAREIGRHALQLQRDHRAARAGFERRAATSPPSAHSAFAAAPSSSRRPTRSRARRAPRASSRPPGGPDASAKIAPPTTDADPHSGIARRAERQRLERDELEHRADEQAARGLADQRARRASRRRRDARSSPAESSRRRGRAPRRAARAESARAPITARSPRANRRAERRARRARPAP